MTSTPYSVETRWGGSEDAPSGDRLREIIAELEVADEEHPDTWLLHTRSGWTLRLDEERFAYLEDPELNTVCHLRSVTPLLAFELWLTFSNGGPEAVEAYPWTSGPRVYTKSETEAIHERSRAITLESDRQFFESLGPEEPNRKCKREGCERGAIKYSVLCPRHHFEQLRGKPYPL